MLNILLVGIGVIVGAITVGIIIGNKIAKLWDDSAPTITTPPYRSLYINHFSSPSYSDDSDKDLYY